MKYSVVTFQSDIKEEPRKNEVKDHPSTDLSHLNDPQLIINPREAVRELEPLPVPSQVALRKDSELNYSDFVSNLFQFEHDLTEMTIPQEEKKHFDANIVLLK